MSSKIDYAEVSKHASSESCWVVLYDHVYDVTTFLPDHPGGAQIILQLAGKDATEEYDPVHPPGTLEESLSPSANLGEIDKTTLPTEEIASHPQPKSGPPPLDTLLNLDDIEKAATDQITKKAWAYYFSGADDLLSKAQNTLSYQRILIRPRIFVDVTHCSTATTILGHPISIPLWAAPAAQARLAHDAGERGIAAACAKFGAAHIISNNASLTPEQIVEGAPADQIFGWQMYIQSDRERSERMLARANAIPQVKFIVVTLDVPVLPKRELDQRMQHVASTLPIRAGVSEDENSGTSGGGGVGNALFAGTSPAETWASTLPWIARHTNLPIVLKGVQTHEDAYLASLHAPQVKGIIISNHGGRAADTAPPPMHTLLEIRKYCPEVLKKIEVHVDGGIKRGTDVVKALCLGARTVGLGRAALWALGAGGPEGVVRMFEILQDEISTAMRMLGARSVDELGPHFVNTRALERDIYDGQAGFEKLGLWVQAQKAKL